MIQRRGGDVVEVVVVGIGMWWWSGGVRVVMREGGV